MTRERRRLTPGDLAVVALVMLAAGIALGFVFDDADADADDEQLEGGLVGIADIADDPERYEGTTAAIDGRVDEVFGPHSFAVGESFGQGEQIIVVSPDEVATVDSRAAKPPVLEHDRIRAVGEVVELDVDELEDRLDVDLDQELDAFFGDDLQERGDQSALVATDLEVLPRLLPVRDATAAAEIASTPDEFWGTVTSVTGTVTDVGEHDAFTLDHELLVLRPLGIPSLETGDRVEVVGAVRPFDPDQYRKQTDADLDDPLFHDYANRPAIVADSVELVEPVEET